MNYEDDKQATAALIAASIMDELHPHILRAITKALQDEAEALPKKTFLPVQKTGQIGKLKYIKAKEPKPQEKHEMQGMYFVTAAQDGMLGNQGIIRAWIDDNRFGVVLFSWASGDDNGQFIVSASDVEKYFTFTGKTREDHLAMCDYFHRKHERKLPTLPYVVGKGPVKLEDAQ